MSLRIVISHRTSALHVDTTTVWNIESNTAWTSALSEIISWVPAAQQESYGFWAAEFIKALYEDLESEDAKELAEGLGLTYEAQEV